MDFVIAGLALGSILAIVGFVMREAGLSRRVSLPWWFSGTGLVLMSAAVAVWCLTFASLITDQPDSTATTLIASGAVVSLIAGFVLLAKAGASRAPAVASAVADANVRMIVDPIDAMATVAEQSEQANEQTDDSGIGEEVQVPVVRDRQDWEAIWRETWGSGELPRAMDSAPASELEPTLEESETLRKTWSPDAEAVADAVAQPARERSGGNVQVEEQLPDADKEENAVRSPNGEAT